MKHASKVMALAAAALMLGAGGVDAQERDRDAGWWTPAVLSLIQGIDRDDRYDDRFDDRYEDRRDRDARRGGEKARNGNGPPFCRNGQGHPVHGWQWCVDKGWAGSGYDRYDRRDDRNDRWDRAPWEIILDRRREGDRRDDRRRVGEPTLGDVLGDVVLGRLTDHGDRLGYRGEVDGRWMAVDDGEVLQLRMGGMPLAELTDRDRDGRVDLVLLSRGR